MIGHRPWIGRNYEQRSLGSRVLIAGFSHWSDEPDLPDFTERQVRQWSQGDEPKPFGNRLRAFFGINDPGEFWNAVAFFNTLPGFVGGPQARYEQGDAAQRALICQRVLDVIDTVQPERVFVFSRKAWRQWPDYTGALKNGTLRIDDVGEYDAGTYRHPQGEAIAFGFPHPQYTPVDPTAAAVAAALRTQVADLAPIGDV